jgi:asparagine synthetase B (glutamine-hydrolysing)
MASYSTTPLFHGEKPSAAGLAKVFKDVISDFSLVPNVGLSLSGGLDSRILLAAGFKGSTFTWGYRKENDEIKLAEECAKATGNPWNFVHLNPESFLDCSGKGDALREGLDLFVQSYALESYPQVVEQGVTGLITGLALDFTMAGSYTPKEYDNLSEDDVVAYAQGKIEYFDSAQREELITSEKLKEAVKDVESFIFDSLIKGFERDGGIKSIQNFFEEHRVRRWIFQRQLWQRAFVEDYIPTYDNRLVDYLSLFSLEQRANHKLFKDVLAELSLSLSEIPYQGTNLPPKTPIEFWGEGTRLEEQKEKLARTVFYETKGEVFVPYNRYYSNFDEWFRVDLNWQETAKTLLFSEETLITQFVNQDVVARMLEEQKSGKKTHFGRLIILMSLEKTLRTFNS